MNIVQMRRGMGASGSPLPYDAEIEYIIFNGTQYLSFPETFQMGTDDFFMDFTPLHGYVGIFGSRGNPWQNNNVSCSISSSNVFYLDAGNGRVNRLEYNANFLYNVELCVEVRKGLRRLSRKIDDFTYVYEARNLDSYSTLFNFEIGRFLINGTPVNDLFAGYLFKSHWIRNGSYLYNMIPVRVGNVGYLYNKVDNTLMGSATSSTFLPGPDVQ